MAKLDIKNEFLSPIEEWDLTGNQNISDDQKKTYDNLRKEVNEQIARSKRQHADAYHKASSYLSF